MRKRLSGSLGLAAVIMLLSANVAAADITLGSTAMPPGAGPAPCEEDRLVAQATSDPSIPYTVPVRGTITGWQINPIGANPGDAVTLVVLRPAGGNAYSVVGADAETLPAGGASFTTSIAVEAGDTLGIFTDSEDPPVCFWALGGTPPSATLMALTALSQPSAGQVLSTAGPSSPGGFMLNLAATLKPADAGILPPPPLVPAQPAAKCTVLKLTRTPVSVARKVLSALGCKAGKTKRVASRKVPKGTVIRTMPKPGAYPGGRKVGLVVSSGPKKGKQKQKR